MHGSVVKSWEKEKMEEEQNPTSEKHPPSNFCPPPSSIPNSSYSRRRKKAHSYLAYPCRGLSSLLREIHYRPIWPIRRVIPVPREILRCSFCLRWLSLFSPPSSASITLIKRLIRLQLINASVILRLMFVLRLISVLSSPVHVTPELTDA